MANLDVGQGLQYLYPDTFTNATDAASNYMAGIPDWSNQVYQNWYNQPLSTGETPNLTTAYGNLMNPDQQWVQGVQGAQQAAAQAQPYMQQAAGLYQQNAAYDPNQIQQYLNPYVQNVVEANTNLSNRNLFENVLPNVSSTFTGAGQFGSSRNADFTNRAIRDQQQALANTNANVLLNAQNAANQNYLNWAQQGNQSAAGLGGLGTNQLNYASTLANLAGTGANLTQQNLVNQMTAAQAQQQLQQQTLDKAYQDYLTQQKFPLEAANTITGGLGNLAKAVQPNVYSPKPEPTDVDKILSVISAAQAGLNDTSIQGILNYLNMGDIFGTSNTTPTV